MSMQLQMPSESMENITFHHVHRLSKQDSNRTRPIIAKFEHYQQKEMVLSKGKLLKNTNVGKNNQFPREINERRKVLYPILKEHHTKNKRVIFVVDKLYLDGQIQKSGNHTMAFLMIIFC